MVQHSAQCPLDRLPHPQVQLVLTKSIHLDQKEILLSQQQYDTLSKTFSLLRYMNRPVMSGAGLYDPTSIMNADTLNKCQVPYLHSIRLDFPLTVL